jgi:hypothetical protein
MFLQEYEIISQKSYFDPSLLNVTNEPMNQTHIGRIFMDFYQDISTIFVRLVVTSEGTTYVDQNINFCKWLKNPRVGFIVTYFENRCRKLMDPQLLNCPIKKGFYLASIAKTVRNDLKNFLNAPSFIPLKGTFNFTKVLKTKIKNKIRPFYMTSEIFRFV